MCVFSSSYKCISSKYKMRRAKKAFKYVCFWYIYRFRCCANHMENYMCSLADISIFSFQLLKWCNNLRFRKPYVFLRFWPILYHRYHFKTLDAIHDRNLYVIFIYCIHDKKNNEFVSSFSHMQAAKLIHIMAYIPWCVLSIHYTHIYSVYCRLSKL